MTEALFWFFLVVGPLEPGKMAEGKFAQFETRQECWMAHATVLGDKDEDWLKRHLVTPCGSHPAVVVPPAE